MKVVANNKRALYNYHILHKYEAGIMLYGSEVKSVLKGGCQLKDSYVDVIGTELFLFNAHISTYPDSSYNNHEPERQRKLLMHRHEIDRIVGFVKKKGLTIIPIKMYFKKKCKLELGVAKGKKKHDKRVQIKERDEKRNLAKAMKLS